MHLLTKLSFVFIVVTQAIGCATWGYSVEFHAKSNVSAAETEKHVEVGYVGSQAIGELTVVNHSSETAYIVWNSASSIDGTGLQSKAYKGSQRRIHSELSVPDQPVAPGARVQETIVFDIDGHPYDVVQQRPATTVDYALGWVYGLGVFIGNGTWKPDEAHIETVVPRWRNENMVMTIDIKVAGETNNVRLDGNAKAVQTVKIIAKN